MQFGSIDFKNCKNLLTGNGYARKTTQLENSNYEQTPADNCNFTERTLYNGSKINTHKQCSNF